MKLRKISQTLALAALLSIGGVARADLGDPYALVAGMSQEEREQLKKKWRSLPPEERQTLRQRMREHEQDDGGQARDARGRDTEQAGYGRGYERRKRHGDRDGDER